MAANDIVTSQDLGNEFDIGNIQADTIRLKIGSNLARAIDGTISVSLTTTSTTKLVGFSGGNVNPDGTTNYLFNASVVRTAAGRYTVTYGSAHPLGADHDVQLTPESNEPNRDQRKLTYFNVTANGFDVVSTVDDNGGTADPYADIGFTFTSYEELNIITSIT